MEDSKPQMLTCQVMDDWELRFSLEATTQGHFEANSFIYKQKKAHDIIKKKLWFLVVVKLNVRESLPNRELPGLARASLNILTSLQEESSQSKSQLRHFPEYISLLLFSSKRTGMSALSSVSYRQCSNSIRALIRPASQRELPVGSTWLASRAWNRGFASATSTGQDVVDEKLPLAGLKVLDMTRVLAGVSFRVALQIVVNKVDI
jgi:hypothetical protein